MAVLHVTDVRSDERAKVRIRTYLIRAVQISLAWNMAIATGTRAPLVAMGINESVEGSTTPWICFPPDNFDEKSYCFLCQGVSDTYLTTTPRRLDLLIHEHFAVRGVWSEALRGATTE